MQTLLFTGKGGVGKSTLAAATAWAAAEAGHRTLVMSADAAHSLADALGHPAGAEPSQVAPRLWVQHVDAQARFEESWSDIERYLRELFAAAGVEAVAAEELSVLPGAEEVFALLEVRAQVRSGRWDVVILDCAPTAETLRLLSLPEALGWYFRRLMPMQRRVVRTLKPVLTKAAGVPMPTDSVFDALDRLQADLADVQALLTGEQASVRLVLTPETVVLSEARRAYTLLSMFGYRVDGVLANRVFPDGSGDAWLSGWVRAQQQVLSDLADSFAGLSRWTGPYRACEPVGREELLALAGEVYGTSDPTATAGAGQPMTVTAEGDRKVLHLAMPLVDSHEVDLARKGDELVISVGSYRRLLTLPSGLARHRVAGARVRDGQLQVRFEQAPEEQS